MERMVHFMMINIKQAMAKKISLGTFETNWLTLRNRLSGLLLFRIYSAIVSFIYTHIQKKRLIAGYL